MTRAGLRNRITHWGQYGTIVRRLTAGLCVTGVAVAAATAQVPRPAVPKPSGLRRSAAAA
jgi:hypothetical protein